MLAQKNDFLTVILSSFDSSWITMTSCPHPLQNVNKRTIAIPSSIYFATNYADEQSISPIDSYMSMCPTSKEQQKYPFLTNFDYGLVYLNISYRKTNVIFRIICLSSCSKKRKLLGKNSLWLFNFKDEK